MNLADRTKQFRKRIPWNKGMKGNYPYSFDLSGERNPFFGKHHSKSTKQKLSNALSGRHLSEDAKQKLSNAFLGENNPLFGKHHTEVAKQKMSNRRKANPLLGAKNPFWGKHHSKIIKQQLAARLREKNPNWNGGTSFLPYPPIFNGELKQLIKQRDGNQCQNPDCGEGFSFLMPHHINYDKNDCRPLNLIALCQSCNGKANSHREEWKQLYQRIVRGRTTERFMRMAA
ncbi:MAG: NUMOD3 domain-containing DNA-binding protein [Desulfobacterales bacterium]|nr:NUMOD3 domain-containing DNA-binding protein [Desulfobacterales bacterium]